MLTHIFLSTLIISVAATTNSTEPVQDPGEKPMHAKAIDYFILGWPILISSGMVGGVLGAFYYYLNILKDWF